MGNEKKGEIQDEALAVSVQHRRSGLAISMGVGKTLIGLRYIDYFLQDRPLRVLVVAPKVSIFTSWREEAEIHGYTHVLDCIEFVTYRSLTKKSKDYDILILDECHSLLTSHRDFLDFYGGMILGLTGTEPRYKNSEKGSMVSKYCPIRYNYRTDKAVEDTILNDYRIVVHMLELSPKKDLPVKLKNGKVFYTSELESCTYWTRRVIDAQSPKEKQICSIQRMKSMMTYPSKERYAMDLAGYIEEKLLIFCNTKEQAEKLCPHSYHSTNPDNEENLRLFKLGDIMQMSCVLQLNEGVNIPNLKQTIILHAYGNERKSPQRIGRLLRLSPDEMATVHILCYRNTQDEKWIQEALRDLDQDKIQYYYIKERRYEPKLLQ